MRRFFLVSLLASVATLGTFAKPPNPKQPDYASWNDTWVVTFEGGKPFLVNVKVSNPMGAGSHTFQATFIDDGGKCSIGEDAPQNRDLFINGHISGEKLTGTIFLCTENKKLAEANHLSAVYSRTLVEANYDSTSNLGSINGSYKNEHYEGARSSGSTYARDEPGDRAEQFEMHIYRPGYDRVPHHETNPPPTPTPQKLDAKWSDQLKAAAAAAATAMRRVLTKAIGGPDY